jgi:rod shape determining protein RodA
MYLLLVFIGWVNIYAAVFSDEHQNIFDISQRYGKQMIWIILAILFVVCILIIDSNFYTVFAYLIYGLITITLLAVIIFGKEINGARAWFEIAGLRIQPGEFAKFATALALAKFIGSYNFKLHSYKNLIIIGLLILGPAALIILQNDTGTAVVFVAFTIVLYREGLTGGIFFIGILFAVLFITSLMINILSIILTLLILAFIIFGVINKDIKILFIAVSIFLGGTAVFIIINELFSLHLQVHILISTVIFLLGLFSVVIAYKSRMPYVYFIIAILFASISFSYSVDYLFKKVLEKHQRTRINVLIGIEQDLKGAGYNVNQSLIAIGSGGFKGKGFLQGTQTKYNFVPEQSTDFIFCTVGEEWGFVGTSFTIILFILLMTRIIFLSERQKSTFSRVFGYSVVSIIFIHFIVNIGMTIGLFPVIGIPLPFFSYGGSSLWGFTILLFVFLRLDASRLELLT